MSIIMGVPKLNKYILEKCSKSVSKIVLEDLYEKKIAVDISIYLYKFLTDGNFMEDLYLFLSIFKYYCIEPIFVFDGKPPPEKRELLNKRYNDRQQAYLEYKTLEEKKDGLEEGNYELVELEKSMEQLQKKMVRIKKEHIEGAIELMNAYGFTHYFAPSEADHFCAYLVETGVTYAVLSDDMDMFLLGCPMVLRGINLFKHTVFLYNTESILRELGLSCSELRKIVVLAGTDYNSETKISIRTAFQYYNEFMSLKNGNGNGNGNDFYEWLHEVHHIDTNIYKNANELYTIDHYRTMFDEYMKSTIPEKPSFNVSSIKSIMRPHNFIFVI